MNRARRCHGDVGRPNTLVVIDTVAGARSVGIDRPFAGPEGDPAARCGSMVCGNLDLDPVLASANLKLESPRSGYSAACDYGTCDAASGNLDQFHVMWAKV